MINNGFKPTVTKNLIWLEQKSLFGKPYYLFGNTKTERYLKVNKDKARLLIKILPMFNGKKTISDIRQTLMQQSLINIDVDGLCRVLGDAGLLNGFEDKNTNSEISLLGIKIFQRKFKGTSKKIKKISKFIFFTLLVLSAISLFLGVFFILFNDNNILSLVNKHMYIYNASIFNGLLVGLIISLVSILLHELAHWLAAISFGLDVGEFSFSLYAGFIPFIYYKFKNIILLEPQKRVFVVSAGLYTNFVIFVISLFLITTKWFSGNINDILGKVLISNYYLIIANIIPFKLCDGYYLMSIIMNSYNTRLSLFRSIIIGEKRGFVNTTRRKKIFLLFYSIISLIFLALSFRSFLFWILTAIFEVNIYLKVFLLTMFIAIFLFLILVVIKRFIVLRSNYKEMGKN